LTEGNEPGLFWGVGGREIIARKNNWDWHGKLILSLHQSSKARKRIRTGQRSARCKEIRRGGKDRGWEGGMGQVTKGHDKSPKVLGI
jgi:hypothetical protein